MEEDYNNPSETNSIFLLNKKRKFQAEQLGLPLPKYKCWDRSFSSECASHSNTNPKAEDFYTRIIKEKIDGGARDDESEPDSAKGSNSFPGDADSVMSVSGEAQTDLQYAQTCPYDWPSTSSVNWGGDSFKTTLYSLDSRSLTKSSADRKKSPYIDEEHYSAHQDLGLHTSPNYEEHLLEFGRRPEDYSCSEDRNDCIEQCTDKEFEDFLSSNGLKPNYVLSSGRWNVDQVTQQRPKKLTIDKEFEQYFSMLMLQ